MRGKSQNFIAAYEQYLTRRLCRVTRPRLTIVTRVQMQRAPFSADDLLQDLAGVSRPTVYRTLHELTEAGLLRVESTDGKSRYRIA